MNDIISLITEFLSKENIDYVIVGGLAAIFYGVPRTSMDLDIIVQIPESKIDGFVKFLGSRDFFVDKWDLEESFREKSHCTIQDKNSLLRLDVKGAYTELDKKTLKRRISFEYNGKKIYLASAEDTIANKLLFGREQDVKDVEGIYARQYGKLDMEFLEKRCKELKVWKEFLAMKKRVEKIINK